MKIRVTDYFDVWTDEDGGWTVNNQSHYEHKVKIKDIFNRKSVLKLMKRLGYISKMCRTTQLIFTEFESGLEILKKKDGMPLFFIEDLGGVS